MKRLIFLDWDGVMCAWLPKPNPEYVFEGGFQQMCDRRCLHALDWLLNVSAAKIVISSSWRAFVPEPERWQGELLRVGVVSARVIGVTTRRDVRRGLQIADWLYLNNSEDVPFVILDDCDDMEPHMARLVQTKMHVGLTMDDARRAAKMLGVETREAG